MAKTKQVLTELEKPQKFSGIGLAEQKKFYEGEGWHFTKDEREIPSKQWAAANDSPIFPRLWSESLMQIFDHIEELKSANSGMLRDFIENSRARFDAGWLPEKWRKEKFRFEDEDWQFDYDAEKSEWSAAHDKFLGVTGVNDFGRLLGIVGKNSQKDQTFRETIHELKDGERWATDDLTNPNYITAAGVVHAPFHEKPEAAPSTDQNNFHRPETQAMLDALTNAPFADIIPAASFMNPALIITDLPKDEKKFTEKVEKRLAEFERLLEGDINRYEQLCRSTAEEVRDAPEWNSPLINLNLKISHITYHKQHINACLMLLGEPTRYPVGDMPRYDTQFGKWESPVWESVNTLGEAKDKNFTETDENEISESVGGFSIDLETSPAKTEIALPLFAFESVRVKLTEKEQRDRDSSLRNAMNLRDAEISRFAAEKEVHKTNLKLFEADVQKYRQICDSGHEYRDLECPLEYDFQKEAVITRRPDNDEVISRRGMTKEERQKRLF